MVPCASPRLTASQVEYGAGCAGSAPRSNVKGMTSDYAPTPVEDFLDPDDPTLFPRLTSEQVEYLAEIGTQAVIRTRELVFEHGQRETPLYVGHQRGPGHHRPSARG